MTFIHQRCLLVQSSNTEKIVQWIIPDQVTKEIPLQCKLLQPPYELISPTLSDEKLQQLTEQHNRHIKAEVDGYVRPSFLCTSENKNPSTASGTVATVSSNEKRCCSVCDGKGHVQPGKKRHFSEKYCPIAAKQAKT